MIWRTQDKSGQWLLVTRLGGGWFFKPLQVGQLEGSIENSASLPLDRDDPDEYVDRSNIMYESWKENQRCIHD
jgi:hypothetical protein